MEYSFLTGLKKAAITAGVTALGIGTASFFGAFDSVTEWTSLGVPQFAALAAVAGVEALRNFIKQALKSIG